MHRRPHARRARVRRLLLLPALLAGAALLLAACDIGTWHWVGTEKLDPVLDMQGLATVVHSDGTASLTYDGIGSVPSALQSAGWNHVGDPDSAAGYVFRDYQNASSSAGVKLFTATTPAGTTYDYLHTLAAGEEYNNSWVAVSPDTQWMLAGEWDTMTRFLVFPTPVLNPATSPTGGSLDIAAQVHLDTPVTDIQGCDFVTPTRLICSSDDPTAENGLPRKPLLQVDLARPLDGGDVDGHVSVVGPIPLTSSCPITAVGSWPDDFEVEGVDFDPVHQLLRVEVVPPGGCALKDSAAFVYRDTSGS